MCVITYTNCMYAFSLDNQGAIISSIKDHESIKATFFVDVSLILIYFMTFMYTCTQHRLFELNDIYVCTIITQI